MADGISATVGDDFLALILNGTSFAGYSATYVQLHTGAPGSAGTANVAGESTRVAAGAFAAPSAGSTTNSSSITWTSVTTSETYSHVSLWSALTSGTFIASGTITASAVTAGDNFQIPATDMTVSIPVAS